MTHQLVIALGFTCILSNCEIVLNTFRRRFEQLFVWNLISLMETYTFYAIGLGWLVVFFFQFDSICLFIHRKCIENMI
jgi:hypothetical protein